MKSYLLPAAIENLCKRIIQVYERLSTDLSHDREAYVKYYADMGHHLFIAKSYTRFSDILNSIENGRWNIIMLDETNEEGILVWLEEITERASEMLEEARHKAIKGDDFVTNEYIERINQ